jgi:CRP/FNR family transcriptional regulator, anaerobic regulatory protein
MPVASTSRSVPCEECPFRSFHSVFRDFNAEELDFVSRFKAGELQVERGTSFLVQGATSEHLFTVLAGWAFRYKMLPDGRRQILNYALPGDFVGLQASVLNHMEHSVEALTDMVLCIFPRDKLWELHRGHPTLAFDLTWLAAREEQILDENLLSVGRRSALERIAYLMLHLFTRAKQLNLAQGNKFEFPLTQQHVADTLGMSLVHANKTLQRLRRSGTVRWNRNEVEIVDAAALARAARYDVPQAGVRPFI